MQTQVQVTGWHIRNWGVWGWLETAIKAVGIIAGIIAFLQTDSSSAIALGNIPNIIAVGILALLTLVFFGLLLVRVRQQEIISILFSVANVLGHTGMLFYLLHSPQQAILPLIMGISYALGEGVKQVFIMSTGYTENGMDTAQILMVGRVLIGLYILFSMAALL